MRRVLGATMITRRVLTSDKGKACRATISPITVLLAYSYMAYIH